MENDSGITKILSKQIGVRKLLGVKTGFGIFKSDSRYLWHGFIFIFACMLQNGYDRHDVSFKFQFALMEFPYSKRSNFM